MMQSLNLVAFRCWYGRGNGSALPGAGRAPRTRQGRAIAPSIPTPIIVLKIERAHRQHNVIDQTKKG